MIGKEAVEKKKRWGSPGVRESRSQVEIEKKKLHLSEYPGKTADSQSSVAELCTGNLRKKRYIISLEESYSAHLSLAWLKVSPPF